MLSHVSRENEISPLAARRGDAATPEFNSQPKPIADFVSLPDFPKCALGEHLDIGGFTGVLIEIVNQSLKFKSPEGATRSFNIHRLRVLYGPAIRPEPILVSEPVAPRKETVVQKPVAEKVAPVKPKRVFIAEPDYTAPAKPIQDFAGLAQFPACVYGVHVDVVGFTGVVVEIINQSLKVRSEDGITRSYNAGALKSLYGTAVAARSN
jgi:hypothetical protein